MTSDLFAKKIENLIRLCQQLQHVLHGFEQVVERENDAIRRSDINELEAMTKEKTAFGNAVSDRGHKIRQLMEDLGSAVGMPQNQEGSLQLDDLSSHLLDWSKADSERNILQNLAEQLVQVTKSLAAERLKIFPKLEANSYLVMKLLQYHRETHMFWLDFESESEAVYGKTGRTLASTKKSLITVRT